ncbi:MAG: hypothetical protein QM503_00515 [Bacteroidota bacterium]
MRLYAIFKYLVSLISVIVFLTVTTGFTINSNSCDSNLVVLQSDASQQVECGSLVDVLNSDKTQNPTSCCTTSGCFEPPKNECCTVEKVYHKIWDVYLLPFKAVAFSNYIGNNAIPTYNELSCHFAKIHKEIEYTHCLPPPLSGKQIVVLFHKFKVHP